MNVADNSVAPLRERRADLGLAITFGFFAFTSLFMDSLTGLDVNLKESAYPFARPVYEYALIADPLLIINPPALQAMCFISAFIFGPFTLLLVWALKTGARWIRVPALIYGSALTYSMPVYYFMEFMSETPPPNLVVFFGATLPYLVAPILLVWHMWRSPFWSGAPTPGSS